MEKLISAGDYKWVVDCWGHSDGMRAITTEAIILEVTDNHIAALLYGDTYQVYRRNDYGNLIFDKEAEAEAIVARLPIPGTVIYTIKGNKVLKRTMDGINGYRDEEGMFELYLTTKKNELYTIKGIGEQTFFNEADAYAKRGPKNK